MAAIAAAATAAAAGQIGSSAITANASGGGSSPRVLLPNPATSLLALLLGAGQPGRRGFGNASAFGESGIFAPPDQLTGLAANDPFAQALSQFIFDPVGRVGQDAISLAEGVGPAAFDALRQFDETILPFAREGAETGFRTDVSGSRDLALRNFFNSTLPGIAERAPGVTSRAFQTSASRAGGDIEAQLAALQEGFNESANARRGGLIGNLANLETGRVALGGNIATLLAQLEEGISNLSNRPATRGFDLFTTLAGLGGPGVAGAQFGVGGFPTTDPLASTLGSLAESIPGLAQGSEGFNLDWLFPNAPQGGGAVTGPPDPFAGLSTANPFANPNRSGSLSPVLV